MYSCEFRKGFKMENIALRETTNCNRNSSERSDQSRQWRSKYSPVRNYCTAFNKFLYYRRTMHNDVLLYHMLVSTASKGI